MKTFWGNLKKTCTSFLFLFMYMCEKVTILQNTLPYQKSTLLCLPPKITRAVQPFSKYEYTVVNFKGPVRNAEVQKNNFPIFFVDVCEQGENKTFPPILSRQNIQKRKKNDKNTFLGIPYSFQSQISFLIRTHVHFLLLN